MNPWGRIPQYPDNFTAKEQIGCSGCFIVAAIICATCGLLLIRFLVNWPN
jgi:hypothetical protein